VTAWSKGEERLTNDPTWGKLSPEQKRSIREECGLLMVSKPAVDTPHAIADALSQRGLSEWENMVKAMPTRIDDALAAAAALLEPKARTQLFTEPYMVRFLLHNTLGAWWAGKVLAADRTLEATAVDEDALREACSLPGYSFDMLRFVRDGDDEAWRPAAGAFPSWPTEAKAITMLDPCCGSGHFLTEALAIISALRQTEEELSPANAVDSVLRDNLHGLEIDGRCVQIAAFAVALTAWRIGGWQTLPLPHIAWVGAPPPLPRREFIALADGDADLEYALTALHELFSKAPTLGSLLEPTGGDLFEAEKLREIERLLEPLLARARRVEPEQVEGVISARGMADAASLLHRKYVFQSTNVPYLGRGKQEPLLASFIEKHFNLAKADLATAMLARMSRLSQKGGTISAVTPQNWLFLESYKNFRLSMLSSEQFDMLATLGARAFETIGGEVVNVALVTLTVCKPDSSHKYSGLDVGNISPISRKTQFLQTGQINLISQKRQIANPGALITPEEISQKDLLREFVDTYEGMSTGDNDRYRFCFWELASLKSNWTPYITPPESDLFSGRNYVLRWEGGRGALSSEPGARIQGQPAWKENALAISVVSRLQPVIKGPYPHEKTTVAIIPRSKGDSREYHQ
jgi:hypothetical protein